LRVDASPGTVSRHGPGAVEAARPGRADHGVVPGRPECASARAGGAAYRAGDAQPAPGADVVPPSALRRDPAGLVVDLRHRARLAGPTSGGPQGPGMAHPASDPGDLPRSDPGAGPVRGGL